MLSETGEHTLYFGGLSGEFIEIVWFDQPQVSGEQQMVFEFRCGTQSDCAEAAQLPIATPAASFREVGRNRRTGTPKLTGQPVPFFGRESGRDAINR